MTRNASGTPASLSRSRDAARGDAALVPLGGGRLEAPGAFFAAAPSGKGMMR